MRNILILVLISFLFVGCFRTIKPIEIQALTQISSPELSILSPSSYPKIPFKTLTKYPIRNIILFRKIPDIMAEDIQIDIFRYENQDAKVPLLYKDTNITYDEKYTNKYLSDKEMTDEIDVDVNYLKNYVNFVAKLKCLEEAIAWNSAYSKQYILYCPYYDNQGDKKFMKINANMFFDETKLKLNGADLKKYKLDTEKQFKMDLKEIIESIDLYDMNKIKMQKEELLYDKKYDITAETRAKDLGLICEIVKQDDNPANDYKICKGKEINKICTKKVSEKEWKCKEK